MADQTATMTERGVRSPMRSMVSAWRVGELIGKRRWVALRARPHVTAVAHMVQFLARVEAALRDGHTRVVKAAVREATGAETGCATRGAATRQSPSERSRAVGADVLRSTVAVSQWRKAGEPASWVRLRR
jgi:hypothetical protein